MANRTRSRFHRGSSRPLREVEWAFVEFGSTNVGASPVLLASFASAGTSDLLGPSTIVRTRGMFHVISDQQAAVETILGAFAMEVVSDSARAAGVGSIPTPFTQGADEGFFVYQPYAQAAEGFATGEPGAEGLSYMVDSKAQRKLEPGEAIVLTAENSTNHSGCTIFGVLRLLLKLH